MQADAVGGQLEWAELRLRNMQSLHFHCSNHLWQCRLPDSSVDSARRGCVAGNNADNASVALCKGRFCL